MEVNKWCWNIDELFRHYGRIREKEREKTFDYRSFNQISQSVKMTSKQCPSKIVIVNEEAPKLSWADGLHFIGF